MKIPAGLVPLLPELMGLKNPPKPGEVPQRIDLLHQVLAVISKESDPEWWALLQAELGNALLQNSYERLDNDAEQAIDAYRKALTVMTKKTMPIEWAMVMGNLGGIYIDRVHGHPSENIEQAILACEQALKIITQQIMPNEWAKIMNNLGRAYLIRVMGERAENIEQAIFNLEQALQMRTRQNLPTEWAETINNLGVAYYYRMEGSRSKNIQQAIGAYKQAIQVRTRQSMHVEWAQTMTNLGNAYLERTEGGIAENIELAIETYQQALQVITRHSHPVEWAGMMNNLASAYLARVRGWRGENIEEVILTYEMVLQVRTREKMPFQWAETMTNLATAYLNRYSGDLEENIERSIAAYQQAMEIITYQTMPFVWAKVMNNLGLAYIRRIRGDRGENIEQAIATYRQALQTLTLQATRIAWAETMHNLASAYQKRVLGVHAENIQQSIAACEQALQVRTFDTMLLAHCQTQRNLGDAYFAEGLWSKAYTAYAAALEAGEALYHAGSTTESRQVETGRLANLPARAAYCLCQMENYTEAVQVLERSKARALGEALARNEAIPKDVRNPERDALISARKRIADLEVKARAIGSGQRQHFLAVSEDLRQARQDLEVALSRIRAYIPDFMPEGLDFPGIVSVVEALKQPIVYILSTSQGSLALIVSPGTISLTKDDLIPLNDFHAEDLNMLLHAWGYLLGIVGTEELDIRNLRHSLNKAWPMLNNCLMSPIITRLHDMKYSQAILIPIGELNLLPLPALSSASVSLTFAPSARAMLTALAVAKGPISTSQVLLGVCTPRSNRQSPLPSSQVEIEAIASLFADSARHVLCDSQATRDAILHTLPKVTHLHFACHGIFNLWQPLDSALFLAEDDTLTLRHLLDGGLDLSAVRLTILSACQTGVTDFLKVPDEVVGLPAGFMQAGVPGVVGTLWPVNDLSTALLMIKFYEYYLKDRLVPVEALWKAQQWLRDVTHEQLCELLDEYRKNTMSLNTQSAFDQARKKYEICDPFGKPFSDPYHWSAFAFYGV